MPKWPITLGTFAKVVALYWIWYTAWGAAQILRAPIGSKTLTCKFTWSPDSNICITHHAKMTFHIRYIGKRSHTVLNMMHCLMGGKNLKDIFSLLQETRAFKSLCTEILPPSIFLHSNFCMPPYRKWWPLPYTNIWTNARIRVFKALLKINHYKQGKWQTIWSALSDCCY